MSSLDLSAKNIRLNFPRDFTFTSAHRKLSKRRTPLRNLLPPLSLQSWRPAIKKLQKLTKKSSFQLQSGAMMDLLCHLSFVMNICGEFDQDVSKAKMFCWHWVTFWLFFTNKIQLLSMPSPDQSRWICFGVPCCISWMKPLRNLLWSPIKILRGQENHHDPLLRSPSYCWGW